CLQAGAIGVDLGLWRDVDRSGLVVRFGCSLRRPLRAVARCCVLELRDHLGGRRRTFGANGLWTLGELWRRADELHRRLPREPLTGPFNRTIPLGVGVGASVDFKFRGTVAPGVRGSFTATFLQYDVGFMAATRVWPSQLRALRRSRIAPSVRLGCG